MSFDIEKLFLNLPITTREKLTLKEKDDLDNLIKWGNLYGIGYFGSKDYIETQPLPKDDTIYRNNNKYFQFSEDGIEERCLKYWGKMGYKDIKKRMEHLKKKAVEEYIKDRFEILDL